MIVFCDAARQTGQDEGETVHVHHLRAFLGSGGSLQFWRTGPLIPAPEVDAVIK